MERERKRSQARPRKGGADPKERNQRAKPLNLLCRTAGKWALPSGEAAGASSELACDDAPTPAVLVRAQPEEQPRLLDDNPTKNHVAVVAAMTVLSVRRARDGCAPSGRYRHPNPRPSATQKTKANMRCNYPT